MSNSSTEEKYTMKHRKRFLILSLLLVAAQAAAWRQAGRQPILAVDDADTEVGQGRLGRTHLVSPQMAAAAAIAGRFVDIRELH